MKRLHSVPVRTPEGQRRDHRTPFYKFLGFATTPLGGLTIFMVLMIPLFLLLLVSGTLLS